MIRSLAIFAVDMLAAACNAALDRLLDLDRVPMTQAEAQRIVASLQPVTAADFDWRPLPADVAEWAGMPTYGPAITNLLCAEWAREVQACADEELAELDTWGNP